MAAAASAAGWQSAAGAADDAWRPFAGSERATQRSSGSPENGRGAAAMRGGRPEASAAPGWGPVPGADARSRTVERSELAPVMAPDGSGLPFDLWTGLDAAGAERLIAKLEIPPRSPALSALWRRLLIAEAAPPAGAAAGHFTAVRIEGLYRSGGLEQARRIIERELERDRTGAGALLLALAARHDVALGRRESGCERTRAAVARRGELPAGLRNELLVLSGYCAAAAGNPAGAGLAATLAREEGYEAPILNVLDAAAAGRSLDPGRLERISPIHYRLLQLAGAAEPAALLQRADAALLAVLAGDGGLDPRLRLAAAELAAGQDIIGADALAAVYREQRFGPAELADPLAAGSEPLLRRALLLQAAEREQSPERAARLLRALLDDARRRGLYLHALLTAAPLVASLPPRPEIAWFAETAAETAVAAGHCETARAWIRLVAPEAAGRGGLEHWLALCDIASVRSDEVRGSRLAAVEELALRGRLSPVLLQRLATVLDALDYQVPMGLWHAAASAPQPSDGHLPETGVLPELVEASRGRQYGRTALLAMQALGPRGPEGAHIIALGDAIRSLRRAGLDGDARRLAFEALFAAWPRAAAN